MKTRRNLTVVRVSTTTFLLHARLQGFYFVNWPKSLFAGYGVASFAPGHYDPAKGQYLAGHSIIKSHARAWHVYNDNYRQTQGGQCGITLNSNWAEPQIPTNPDHIDAAVRILLEMLN